MKRRRFIAAGTGLAAGITSAAPFTLGATDVQRLQDDLGNLLRLDDQNGGGPELERRAVALSDHAVSLQTTGRATTRIRSRLYSLAASFRALALWAAIDSRRLDQAGRHMETAVTLAGLSRDGLVQHQVWRFASSLAIQRGNWIEATAANEAAALTSVHRRDPLYASLTNARLAVTLAKQEPARARRALDRAELAFGRADLAAHRPVAMEFYTRSELDGLLGVAHLHLGEPEAAEARFHRSIAGLRPEQHRNRAYYTVHAAQAQLRQRDIEQACATAATVIPPPWSTESGRIPHMLGGFTKQLRVTAPDASITREWLHQIRAAD
ncbi:hypothetical protein [Streptomyces sp. NPDC059256]|uniref:hypothetical protein n=1 Tax=Streptomyces sp. NPDC059256 TaxID=3346794 RepID=UPI0036CE2469